MKSYGTTGSAAGGNDQELFRGFSTDSGRDILTDLERAHTFTSPLHDGPILDEIALTSQSRKRGKRGPHQRTREVSW